MAIAGWVPWLADTFDPDQGPEAFHTYTSRGLGPAASRGDRHQHRRAVAALAAGGSGTPPSVCPECATDHDRGVALTTGLLLMLSCPNHGCLLEPEGTVRIGYLLGVPTPARTAPVPVAAADRLTWEALTTGTVTLPARPVHLGVWLRLLRTLIGEVSISTSRLRAASARMLEQVWEASGYPPRGGITVGDGTNNCAITSKTRCSPAATVLHLAQTGVITRAVPSAR